VRALPWTANAHIFTRHQSGMTIKQRNDYENALVILRRHMVMVPN
jgi:hypothetical protein